MKQFIKTVLLFLFICAVSTGLFFHFFKPLFLHRIYPHWAYAFEEAKKRNDANLLIMGDSRVFYGINPNYFKDVEVKRLSMEASRSYELNYLFQQYINNCSSPPELLILSIAPEHIEGHDDFLKFTSRFSLIPIHHDLEFLKTAHELGESSIFGSFSYSEVLFEYTLRYVGFFSYYTSDLQKADLIKGYQKYNLELGKLRKDRFIAKVKQSNFTNLVIEDRNNFVPSLTLQKYLNQIFYTAEQNQIKVLLKGTSKN